MNKELQRMHDLLGAMQAQRDQAANAVINLQADCMALQRDLIEAQQRIAQLEAQLPKPAEAPTAEQPASD